MRPTSSRPSSLALAASALALLLFVSACSSDDDAAAPAPTATVPAATATSTPTDTAAPTPTATPVPVSFNVFFGSTEHMAGQLFADYDPPRDVRVGIAACLPPDDAPCDGGIAVFSTVLPGFSHVESHDGGRHALAPGTELRLEIVDNADEITVMHDGETAEVAGESVELGVAPIDHVHAEFGFAEPGGEPYGELRTVELRLIAPGSVYAPSEPFLVTLETSDHPDGHGGGNDDGGEDDHHDDEGEEGEHGHDE